MMNNHQRYFKGYCVGSGSNIQLSNCFTSLEIGQQKSRDQQQISFTEVRSLDLQSALFQWEDNSSSKKLPSATIVSGNINIQSKQSICPTTGKEKDKDAESKPKPTQAGNLENLRNVCHKTRSSSSSYGWHVMLWRTDENMFFCQGAVMADQYILTTAHCFVGHGETKRLPPSIIKVRFTKTSKLHPIESIHIHEKFNYGTFDFDVAVLKLKAALKFSRSLQPICLELESSVAAGTKLRQHWWEGDLYDHSYDGNIISGHVPKLSLAECKKKGSKILTKNMVCTGNPDYCGGDILLDTVTNGAPLTTKREGKTILIGLKSLGSTYSCTSGDVSHIFANIGHLRTWISTAIASKRRG